jgi:Helix-turn-helix domain
MECIQKSITTISHQSKSFGQDLSNSVASAESIEQFLKEWEEGLKTAVISFPRLGQSFVNGCLPPGTWPSKFGGLEPSPESRRESKGGQQETTARRPILSRRAPAFWHSALDDLGLSLAAIGVYTFLVRCSDKVAFPSVRKIAKMRGISQSTVMRATKELEAVRLITVNRTCGRVNSYTIRPIEEFDRFSPATTSTTEAPQTTSTTEADRFSLATTPLASQKRKVLQVKRSIKEKRDDDALLLLASDKSKAQTKSDKQPSESEVIEYCVSRDLPKSDGQWLFAHWEGNGFTNKGRLIKNWQATARAWQTQGDIFPSQKRTPKSKPPKDIKL